MHGGYSEQDVTNDKWCTTAPVLHAPFHSDVKMAWSDGEGNAAPGIEALWAQSNNGPRTFINYCP